MRGGERVAALLALTLAGGCANYDERLAEAHGAYYSQNVQGAVTLLESQVAGAEGDNDELILKLEYGLALQTAGRAEESARVFSEVDDSLEVLDYTTGGIEKIAEVAFAPEAAIYRASPPERVMLNTQNMINFLLMGDAQGASVEARRLRNLVTMDDVDEDERFANSFAWALAGFALERAGDSAEAEGARRESGATTFDDRELTEGQQLAEGEAAATILILGQLGQTPIRRESSYYFPVGSTIHRLNLPTMVARPSMFSGMNLELDGAALGDMDVLFSYGAHVRARYDQELPSLLAAAFVQAVGRALVAEAAAKAASEAYESSQTDSDSSASEQAEAELAGNILGFFVGLFTNWTLSEVAGCDTRCWSLLPERLGAKRLNVAPGEHRLVVNMHGANTRRLTFDVELGPGELHVINIVSDTFGFYTPPPDPNSRDMANTNEADQALRMLEQAGFLAAQFN